VTVPRDGPTVGGMELRPPAGGVLVVPMSREEFDALPEMHHTEWWDGACVVTGTARRHGKAIAVLAAALMAVLDSASFDVMTGVGWRLPDAEFVPDLVVVASAPDAAAIFEPPLLLIEVLSPSTRHVDLRRKRQLYAAGGLPWYWVVDLVSNELLVLKGDGATFVEVQRLATGTTVAPISIQVSVPDL
jgi:Uma2 family endonuclease